MGARKIFQKAVEAFCKRPWLLKVPPDKQGVYAKS